MKSEKSSRRLGAVAGAAALALICARAQASELSEGTEINAGNWEQMRSETYEGKTIESMVPEAIQKAVREYGLKITLRRSEPAKLASHIHDATTTYSSQVKYDPATRKVTGWVAGVPFPDQTVIDSAPPEQGGDMVLYNAALAAVNVADNSNCYGPYATLQIDPKKASSGYRAHRPRTFE